MTKMLERQGRIEGFRPTFDDLEKLWELACRDFDNNPTFEIRYRPPGVKIDTTRLNELLIEVKDAASLDRLTLVARQESTRRFVEISIGPETWTTFAVESEDATWALGRYEELAEFLALRRPILSRAWARGVQIAASRKHRWWRRDDTIWEFRPSIPSRKDVPANVVLVGIVALYVAAFAFALLPLNLIADHFMGTPLFSSKEELRQSGITLRTDHWWRLAGCIAYFVGARRLLKLQLRSKVRMAKQKFDYDGWTVASLALSGISAIATVIQTIAS